MINKEDKNKLRKMRHKRVRKKIIGTSQRPRFNVFRSLNNIYVQIIDDMEGKTLVAASSLEPAIKEEVSHRGNKAAAKLVGKLAAQRALDNGIKTVVFDRGGYIYHGRIQEVADGAREAGLDF
ncbi:MAG: 50S ribosomal protein L18 [Mahellales bacterium]